MIGTRQKILRAARVLFNQYGVAKISQRAISDHIAISPGNLTYHFKKRDDIIEALYFELAESLRENFAQVEGKELNLECLMTLTKSINKSVFENRFFMIDFIQITRSNKKIKKDYAEVSKNRQDLLNEIIDNLIEKGVMREEELPNEFGHLFKRMELFGDFWVASIGTTGDEVMLKHTRVYTEMFMYSIYPYLTKKGKKEFLELNG